MPKIDWDESFSVNNKEIDAQHKKWIGIHNKMHEILTGEDRSAKLGAGAEIIKEMLDYAREHFKFEEEYLRKINYPDVVQHRRLHKDFDSKMYEYSRDLQIGEIVLNTEIISLIKSWLLNHIVVEDKKYALFFEMENRNLTNSL